MRASRITYVGELGWELYIPTEFAQAVYDAIVAAGAPFGLRLAGYHALNCLRMEKAYRHWGHDISDEDSPLEAGLQFAVAWDKPGGFVGREALLRQRDAGVRRRLVALPSSAATGSSTTMSRSGGTAYSSGASPPECSPIPSGCRSVLATSPPVSGRSMPAGSAAATTRWKSPASAFPRRCRYGRSTIRRASG